MARIGIVVVAYNAVTTLARVLDRIPQDFRGRVDAVYIGDDHSDDATYLVGLGYRQAIGDLPITVVRHPRNLGYGGNQKAGYRWAIDEGLDIVVLLHGDGQYAPELLPEIVAPLERDECDAVFGSRMMRPGEARRGGMPLYKYVGNRILTRMENAVIGEHLSEWHSGYRAYRVATLRDLPFEQCSDDFNFDTQIIIQLHEARARILEIPIPTFYGDEISRVNGLRYARQCMTDVLRYRAQRMGFGDGSMVFASGDDDVDSDDAERVRERVLRWFDRRPAARVLDLGCGDGELGARLRARGHHVTGVDREPAKGTNRLDRFVLADLEQPGWGEVLGGDYDVVVAADVLAFLRDPVEFLREASARLRPGGTLLVSVPNVAHWYPRTRVLVGKFGYDRRGILDRRHLRFFTRATAARCFADAGLEIRGVEAVGLPVDLLAQRSRGGSGGRAPTWIRRLDRLGVAVRPPLFAYQFLFELTGGVRPEPLPGAAPPAPGRPEPDPA